MEAVSSRCLTVIAIGFGVALMLLWLAWRFFRAVRGGEMDNFERAAAATSALVALIRNRLPVEVEPPDHDPWPMVAWAFLARFAGAAEAVATLSPSRREIDSHCLLRVLCEHVITFAWIAAGPIPERIALFKKTDAAERIKTDNEFRHIKDEALKPEVRAYYEGVCAAIPGELPPLSGRAAQADAHWEGRIEGMGRRRSPYSFSGAYRVLYRHASALTHPTLYGLQRLITNLPEGQKRVHIEGETAKRSPAGMAAVLLGQALFVAAEALGWPTAEEVNAIFDEYDWTG